jgi:general secretion pathway protein D
MVAAALIGCDTWPEQDYERAVVETRPAGPLTGTPRRTPTELGALGEDEGAPVERVVQRGTGTFLSAPTRRPQAAIVTEADGGITLNVVDGELREVVRMVLEAALGANYVIDPTVGGRITIQTTRPLPAEDLVPVLDSVLRMNGAALVQTGDLFKVVPIDQALTAGPMPELRPLPNAGAPGFGVQVVPLQFVSATELGALLEPFTPPGGTIGVDARRNLLLLAGSGDQLAALRDLVSIFDVDRMRGMSFGLFPLENATAPDVALELDQIFGSGEAGSEADVVRFVPIERLNAVLMVSAQPDYLDEAATWIRRLDRTGDGEEPQIYVYPAQNARAATLAEVLSEIFGARTVTVGEPSLLAPGRDAVALRSAADFELGSTAGEEEQLLQEEAEGRERAARPELRRPEPASRLSCPPRRRWVRRMKESRRSASSPTIPPIRSSSALCRATIGKSGKRSSGSTSCRSRC